MFSFLKPKQTPETAEAMEQQKPEGAKKKRIEAQISLKTGKQINILNCEEYCVTDTVKAIEKGTGLLTIFGFCGGVTSQFVLIKASEIAMVAIEGEDILDCIPMPSEAKEKNSETQTQGDSTND